MTTQNAKRVISPDEFVNLINEEIPKHYAYKSGMRAFLVPVVSPREFATGYGCELAGGSIGVFADVSSKILSSHHVEPDLPKDWIQR